MEKAHHAICDTLKGGKASAAQQAQPSNTPVHWSMTNGLVNERSTKKL
jgi:hypothetical protein